MRGMERRQQGRGRRASDHAPVGAPAWIRIGVLVLALGATGYALMMTRHLGQPGREVHRLRGENLALNAQLAASRIAVQIQAAQTGFDAAAPVLGQDAAPLAAVEAARRAPPTSAFPSSTPRAPWWRRKGAQARPDPGRTPGGRAAAGGPCGPGPAGCAPLSDRLGLRPRPGLAPAGRDGAAG
ncbi:hypothetical protein [Brevundimonas aurantiaca]|uniref:hypothetical protein n=1 Tax=Brevundimonas aurantiaca TaxID=74316 RepID=UPI001CD4B563|nr:hypothetical protein [Brevundimonas aurantiaca]